MSTIGFTLIAFLSAELFKDNTIHRYAYLCCIYIWIQTSGYRMVISLLNECNEGKSDRDTKLDVLVILGVHK
jgi:hypothetical protein